ncbi:MAG: His/Gly/Thr/Pro-type tRNA ligase C-terminal domain-containing protein, partial [Acidaminococcaceae bacterium]
WLAPVQATVMPITDRSREYAENIYKTLFDADIRVESDYRNEKIGYKIREAQLQKIPYMLVVGDKEAEAGLVSVRTRAGGDEGTMTLEEFMAKIKKEIADRTR